MNMHVGATEEAKRHSAGATSGVMKTKQHKKGEKHVEISVPVSKSRSIDKQKSMSQSKIGVTKDWLEVVVDELYGHN